jgi:hypothetical protein
LSAFLRFPGLPQRTKAFHVLANRDGFLLYIRHRPDAFFLRQTLPVGACDTFRRWLTRFLGYHLSRPNLQTQKARPICRSSGHMAISVHP